MSGKKILVFADWYEPGYKAGGPIRSCVNFAYHMRQDYEVYVFTTDRDLNAAEPYPSVPADLWITRTSGEKVFYCSPGKLHRGTIRRIWQEINPDFVYLNSMFSPKFTIMPLLILLGGRRSGKVILSPRGMLRSSAIQFKRRKKEFFLAAFRLLGIHRRVVFLAADDTESADVRRYFGAAANVTQLPNFPAAVTGRPPVPEKKCGQLSLIFIGRVHPIKNPDYLLRVLREVKAEVRLTIVGSIEDKHFWLECENLIRELPANIRVDYAGEVPNHELPPITARHHVFVLPTRGENFGHAIFEALTLGKPALISDQTPWRGLTAARAGWDLPLDRPESFREAIEQAAAFDQQEYEDWCRCTTKFVEAFLSGLELKEAYKKLFC